MDARWVPNPLFQLSIMLSPGTGVIRSPTLSSSLFQSQSRPLHNQGADQLFSPFYVLLLAIPEAVPYKSKEHYFCVTSKSSTLLGN